MSNKPYYIHVLDLAGGDILAKAQEPYIVKDTSLVGGLEEIVDISRERQAHPANIYLGTLVIKNKILTLVDYRGVLEDAFLTAGKEKMFNF